MRYFIAAFLSLMVCLYSSCCSNSPPTAPSWKLSFITIPECPWCNQAKAIVKEESVKPYVNFTEIDLTGKPAVGKI